jgi:hypothetical protein
MSQVGFGNSTGGCSSCGGSSSTSTTGSGVQYVDQNCPNGNCPEVVDKLHVVGKKAIIDITVDVWDTIGCETDNIVRMYNTDDCVYSDGLFYWSLVDKNIDKPPSPRWSAGYTKCKMLKPGEGGVPPTQMLFPVFSGRAGTINSTVDTTAQYDTFVYGFGGFPTAAGISQVTVPATGVYRIEFRATCKKNNAAASGGAVTVRRNGTPVPVSSINFGTNYFPFMAVGEQREVVKSINYPLNAGDILTVVGTNFGDCGS